MITGCFDVLFLFLLCCLLFCFCGFWSVVIVVVCCVCAINVSQTNKKVYPLYFVPRRFLLPFVSAVNILHAETKNSSSKQMNEQNYNYNCFVFKCMAISTHDLKRSRRVSSNRIALYL